MEQTVILDFKLDKNLRETLLAFINAMSATSQVAKGRIIIKFFSTGELESVELEMT